MQASDAQRSIAAVDGSPPSSFDVSLAHKLQLREKGMNRFYVEKLDRSVPQDL